MTYTLAEATRELTRILQHWSDGTATGGSATTVVDTSRSEPADYWNGGTIWMRSGNNSGKSAKITDWALAGTTLTFPTMTLLNAAADLYTISDKQFPRDVLIRSINQGLRAVGNIDQENTSLVTVADQETYVLPSGVYNVTRVEMANTSSDVSKYSAATIAFVSSSKSITDTASGLAVIATGDRIRISGSTSNDGIYTVATGGVAGTIVVVENLTDEALGDTVTIYLCDEPYTWIPQIGIWKEIPASGIIRFEAERQPGASNYLLRLTYNKPLSEITSDTSTITDYINLERLIYEAAVEAIQWK